jgi:uncharacterized peroxidase-related enzyme
MSRFPSLPPHPGLADVFLRFADSVAPLFEYHDRLLRGPSPLSIGERELLAAYTSALNACSFCAGAHRAVAEVHGIDPLLLDQLSEDPAAAQLEPRLQPLLAYVRKLTLTPARITDADAAAVFDAGWDETALFHAISICGLFNLMNRLVEGCGVETSPEVRAEQRERHQQMKDVPDPYRRFGRMLGIIP